MHKNTSPLAPLHRLFDSAESPRLGEGKRKGTKDNMTESTLKKEKKTTKAKVKKEDPISKLRIRVMAYEYKVLDISVKQIIDTAMRYDAKIVGPIPLPTEIKKWTVNRSPFVYKNAREQFEMRVHRRVIDIVNPSPKIMDSLTNLSLPSGVSIDVKII